jgi:hypothetical protein
MVYYVAVETVHPPEVMLGMPAMTAVISQQILLKAALNSGIITSVTTLRR